MSNTPGQSEEAEILDDASTLDFAAFWKLVAHASELTAQGWHAPERQEGEDFTGIVERADDATDRALTQLQDEVNPGRTQPRPWGPGGHDGRTRAMLNTILRMILGELGPLLELVLTTLTDRGTMDHVVDLARAEVRKLEGDTTLDGDAKRKAASAAIVDDLKTAGKTVAPVLINLAIEVAVSALKAAVKTPAAA